MVTRIVPGQEMAAVAGRFAGPRGGHVAEGPPPSVPRMPDSAAPVAPASEPITPGGPR
jgi:hypothetical protein